MSRELSQHALENLRLKRPQRHRDGNREQRSDDRADGARHQPHERAVARVDRRRVILLHQIRRQRAAEHHPGATAHIADVDDRQRGQHADGDATEQRGLEFRWTHGVP